MGREIRKVRADWVHPMRDDGRHGHRPLYGCSFVAAVAAWDKEHAAWQRGEKPVYAEDCVHYEEWAGTRPVPKDYMPEWSDAERTHWQMYESTSEGTPISPVFATREECARYCADHGVSVFGSQIASYEEWLQIAGGGDALLILTPGNGVTVEIV